MVCVKSFWSEHGAFEQFAFFCQESGVFKTAPLGQLLELLKTQLIRPKYLTLWLTGINFKPYKNTTTKILGARKKPQTFLFGTMDPYIHFPSPHILQSGSREANRNSRFLSHKSSFQETFCSFHCEYAASLLMVCDAHPNQVVQKCLIFDDSSVAP